ncbi:MAG TPA: hypothetical protein PKE03_11570 [Bacteroidales bacterium]|nr:hypothetical protein [Bacteroidales bacterium]
MNRLILVLVSLLSVLSSYAQQSVRDSVVSTALFQASYAFQLPGGDLRERYGPNSQIAAVIGYKTNKNWLWNAHLGFIFGNQVKGREELLRMISTSTGDVIDGDGTYTSLALFERGFHLQAKAGKLFSTGKPNPNSGIYVQGGLGYLAHRIHIETQFGTAPQLAGDYAKGYDHLRGGFAHSFEAGYLFMGSKRTLNFSAGLELISAYTSPLREYSFELMGRDTRKYTDHYIGLRVNWMIPGYRRAPLKYYYF